MTLVGMGSILGADGRRLPGYEGPALLQCKVIYKANTSLLSSPVEP